MLSELQFQVLWRRLIGVADEASAVLTRGSFSPAVTDMKDFAVTLHDAEGNMIAQSRDTGTISILTALIRGVPKVLQTFSAKTMRPGDAFGSNDPWLFAGHKHDVVVISPLFRRGKLIAFAACGLHVADIGGLGLSANGTDVYEEGLEIPLMRMASAGVPDQTLLSIVRANVREPDSVLGDILGQIEVNQGVEARLNQMLDEYDLDDIADVAARIVADSEAAMRSAIRRLPDGEYRASTLMDGMDEPVRIEVTVLVRDSDFLIDFTGTDPQLPYAMNCPLSVTYAWAAHTVRSALAPDVPNNEGCYRPTHVSSPPGTVVNPSRPAPVAARHMVQNALAGVLARALSTPIPHRVVAESGQQSIMVVRGATTDGSPFSFWWNMASGMGGAQDMDGLSGKSFPLSLPTIPVEVMERASPIHVLAKRLVADSCGPGAFQGGFNQEIEFTVEAGDRFTVTPLIERQRNAARGLFDGRDGSTGSFLVDGAPAHGKRPVSVPRGVVVSASGGGGGGYGDPADRDVDRIVSDHADGLISRDFVARWYPHALDQIPTSIEEGR